MWMAWKIPQSTRPRPVVSTEKDRALRGPGGEKWVKKGAARAARIPIWRACAGTKSRVRNRNVEVIRTVPMTAADAAYKDRLSEMIEGKREAPR